MSSQNADHKTRQSSSAPSVTLTEYTRLYYIILCICLQYYEDLHVTLTPVRAISFFYVYRNGEINYDSYRITLDTDGYYLSVNEEPAAPFNKFLAQAIVDIIDKYDVASWDGFAESQDFVLDGEGFWLEFTLTDGTRVLARGDNAFPENYFDAMGEIWEILTR